MLDRQRLIKLMMMTTSSNDGEALVAIRKANAMLKDEKLDWSGFLAITKNQSYSVPPNQRHNPPRKPSPPRGRGTDSSMHSYSGHYNDPDIPRMLASLMRDAKGGFRDFVESLGLQFEEKGWLSEAQYNAIINAYERAKG